MIELGRILEGGNVPVKFPQPIVDGREATTDVLEVALEVLHVHWIEADDGGIETNIRFSQGIAEHIGSFASRQMRLHLLER